MSELELHTGNERVLFFNFALKHGHFMARPVFSQEQSLIGEIIHSLERSNPRFAWIQFLFAKRDYGHLLLYTKNALENYVRAASTPQYDERGRQNISRKEINSQWFKLAAPRIKKIEQQLSKPFVVLAINGMWVTSENGANQIRELPLSLCHDDLDQLKAFVYKSPRILKMLVYRRMVTDLSPSIYKYGRSREEPPSLILTSDEIPFYIHMPSGASARGLSSINPSAHFPAGGSLEVNNVAQGSGGIRLSLAGPSTSQNYSTSTANRERKDGLNGSHDSRQGLAVASLKKIPTLEHTLEEEEATRVSHIVSQNIRTFEVLYDSEAALHSKNTTLLLSSSCETASDDLQRAYIPQLESVYGKLDYEVLSDRRPTFIVDTLPQSIPFE